MNSFDNAYLQLLKNVSTYGKWSQDRTSVGMSKQLFGQSIVLPVHNFYAPLIQCRTFSPRIAFEEWKWMMSGSTDVTELQANNIHIWDGNSTREFLDARGLHNVPTNQIGKAYGYQYRNFGGVTDQVQNVFNSLRDNPTSRRHVVSIWNPNELHEMALEPCAYSYTFVYINGTLNLDMQMRSCDVVYGLPYNMAFCYFWLATFSRALNYKPGVIRINISNAHYYLNQQPLVESLLKYDGSPNQSPLVTFSKPIQSLEDILSLEWSDVNVKFWTKGPKLTDLSIPMAV